MKNTLPWCEGKERKKKNYSNFTSNNWWPGMAVQRSERFKRETTSSLFLPPSNNIAPYIYHYAFDEYKKNIQEL